MAGAIERLLERATLRLEAAAVGIDRGLLAVLRVAFVALGVLLLVAWAAREIGLHGPALLSWFLLPGALLCGISVFVFALRFRHVMSIFDVELRPIQALRINTLSMFYHCFVPLSAGADVTKFIKLRGLAPARRPVVMAGGIVLDHLIGLFSLLLMAITLWLAFEPARFRFDGAPFAALLGAITLAAWLIVRRRLPAVARGAEVLARLRGHKRELAAACALSMLMQCLTAAAIFTGSRGWHIDIGYLDILLVLTLSSALQAIPLNVAGVGAADLAGTGLYLALGLPPPAAVLLVSLMYAYRVLIAALGGLWDLAGT